MQGTEEKTITSVTVDALDLVNLISGVITHASKDKTLTSLNGIHISKTGSELAARSSDRYRLIVGSISCEGEGERELMRLSLDDAKSLLKGLGNPKRKGQTVDVTFIGDLMTIGYGATSFTYTLHPDRFPDHRHLLETGGREALPMPEVSMNPSFFSDYAKIAGKKAQVVIRQYKADQAYHIDIIGDETGVTWQALLMPMRIKK